MNAPLLQVRNVHVGYGHVGVLKDVSLEVRDRSIVALVGSNGAGKTTLLRAVSGLLAPRAGSIHFDGKPIDGARPAAIVRCGLLHVAEGRRLFRTQSVFDNLQLGLFGVSLSKADRMTRFDEVYELFPILRERLKVRAGILSGGQQQMLAIAQALMRAPRLLMLDEPSIGLAPVIIDQVMDVIVKLRQRGTTILIVEQMVERALQIADHAYVLQSGQVIGHGAAGEVRKGDMLRRAYLGEGASRTVEAQLA